MKGAVVEKLNHSKSIPMLVQFTDVRTGTTGDILSPGGMGRIIGEELKFDPANPDEGIFLTSEGVTTKVAEVGTLTDGNLMFLIPDTLLPGIYTLEVRKGYGSTTIAIRSGTLNEALTVS